jgi:hypothetical protein
MACRIASVCRGVDRIQRLRMMLPDRPAPVEASVDTIGRRQGFAQAGNRMDHAPAFNPPP